MSTHLRPWRDDDAAAYLDLYRRNPDLSRQMPPLADEAAALDRIRGQHASGWAFALVVDGRPAGSVSATAVERTHSTAWFSYWMDGALRGRGLTTRAAASLADHVLFDAAEPVFRLELGHRVDNPASGRVAAGAGFRLEGRQRAKLCYDGVRHDTLAYARLRTDPRPAHDPLPVEPT